MIRITRSLLRCEAASTVSTFKKIHKQNLEMHKFLLALQTKIQNGIGTQQLSWLIDDKLREFESFEIEWPAPQKGY